MPGSAANSLGMVGALSQEQQEAALKVDGIQKVKRRSKRQKNPVEQTVSSVKEDAAKILEELLIKRLSMGDNAKSPIGQAYQRVVEIDVEEDCSEKQSNGYAMSPIDLLIDSIPYADDDMPQPIRSKSLPADPQKMTNTRQTASDQYLLANINSKQVSGHKISSGSKSKHRSFLHSSEVKPKSKIKSKSKSLSPRKGEKPIPSPFTDISAHSSTIQPDTLDPQRLVVKRDISHSTTPSPLEGYSHSGSDSSSVGSSSCYSTGRRKKSMIKRAKERLMRAFHKQGENEKDKKKNKASKKKQKSSKINKLPARDAGSDGDILEERHTHRRTRIKQSHQQGCDDQAFIRTEDTWETTDIIEPPKSSRKHIKKHKKVKESSSFENGGIAGKLRRLTSFRRDSKKKSIDVDSVDSGGRFVERKSSVLVDTKGGCETDYGEEEESSSPGHKKSHTIHVITQACQKDNKDVPSTAPCLPPGTYGQNGGSAKRESLNLEGISISGIPDAALRARGSFVVDYEYDSLETKIRSPDGHVTRQIDVEEHKHITLPEDVEIDGNDEIDGIGGKQRIHNRPSMDQTKKEGLYGVIAEKLATMGDNYVAKMHSQNSQDIVNSPSPVISPVGAVGGQSPDDDNNLTSLERELRDYLRSFGDNITKQYALSSNVENAAKEIVKKAVYNKFKQTLRSTIGDDIGWDQLAMLFYVTKKAVGLAGAGGAVALQIKEMSLRYFEDMFAGWIVGQGGWESMLESDSDESDYNLD